MYGDVVLYILRCMLKVGNVCCGIINCVRLKWQMGTSRSCDNDVTRRTPSSLPLEDGCDSKVHALELAFSSVDADELSHVSNTAMLDT